VTYFPFSLLDYGLAVAVLVALAATVYLFVQFLANHMSKVTAVLDELVRATRAMSDEFHRHTAQERELVDEIREMRSRRKRA
jgi:low affinity Fe/Cu permease